MTTEEVTTIKSIQRILERFSTRMVYKGRQIRAVDSEIIRRLEDLYHQEMLDSTPKPKQDTLSL